LGEWKIETGSIRVQVKKGDRVTFHGELGEIELVADPLVDDPKADCMLKSLAEE